MIVVDTNVLVSAAISLATRPEVERLLTLGEFWVAPSLWRSEFRNAMGGYIRSAQLSVQQTTAGYAFAREMLGAEARPGTSAVLKIVAESPLTAYDAEFVALAQLLSAPLVTFDRQVLRAFPEIAIAPQAFANPN